MQPDYSTKRPFDYKTSLVQKDYPPAPIPP